MYMCMWAKQYTSHTANCHSGQTFHEELLVHPWECIQGVVPVAQGWWLWSSSVVCWSDVSSSRLLLTVSLLSVCTHPPLQGSLSKVKWCYSYWLILLLFILTEIKDQLNGRMLGFISFKWVSACNFTQKIWYGNLRAVCNYNMVSGSDWQRLYIPFFTEVCKS